mgnify:FL=1
MKVIYSFKQFSNHYKPLDDSFYRLAKYSVECASKWYKTKLYSDKTSIKVFNSYGVYFDEYEVLEEIEQYKGRNYCIPKLYAMIAETNPYIHLDFDAIVFEKLNFKESITYGNVEIDLKYRANTDAIHYILKHYIEPYRLVLKDKFDTEIDDDWDEIPNHSLIAVKNPDLVRSIYTNILSLVAENELEKVTPMIIEQYLLYRYLVKNKIKVGYISKHVIPGIEKKIKGSYKFYHFQKYNKDTPESNFINNFLKSYYKHTNKLV